MNDWQYSQHPCCHFEDDRLEAERSSQQVLTDEVTYTGDCEACGGPCQGHVVEIGLLNSHGEVQA